MDISLILTVLGIHLLAVISPWPDLVVCLRNSLRYWRKIGVATALWFGAGIGVHILYCSLGLAVLISQSIQLFTLIKTALAFYLLYMWRNSIISKSSSFETSIWTNKQTEKKESGKSFSWALWDWFLTNVLNPKATLFFLSLFTFVVGPTTTPITLLIISSMMMINTALWFSLVAVCATHKSRRRKLDHYQWVINKAFGWILLLLGIKVLTMSSK